MKPTLKAITRQNMNKNLNIIFTKILPAFLQLYKQVAQLSLTNPRDALHDVRSFVHSLRAGVQPTMVWTPAPRPYSGPVRSPRERKGIGWCVRCVLATCRVKEGLSRSEQLVGYFYSAPLLDMAYCLA